MKKLIPFLFLAFSYSLSFAQQKGDLAIAPIKVETAKTTAVADSSPAVTYLVMNTDGKIKGDFKNLSISLSKNPVAGMLSLEIKSAKEWKVLVELKSSDEDVLFFQPVNLKAGDNIIPFETDDNSVISFQLKLSEINSNSSSSYLILKKQ